MTDTNDLKTRIAALFTMRCRVQDGTATLWKAYADKIFEHGRKKYALEIVHSRADGRVLLCTIEAVIHVHVKDRHGRDYRRAVPEKQLRDIRNAMTAHYCEKWGYAPTATYTDYGQHIYRAASKPRTNAPAPADVIISENDTPDSRAWNIPAEKPVSAQEASAATSTPDEPETLAGEPASPDSVDYTSIEARVIAQAMADNTEFAQKVLSQYRELREKVVPGDPVSRKELDRIMRPNAKTEFKAWYSAVRKCRRELGEHAAHNSQHDGLGLIYRGRDFMLAEWRGIARKQAKPAARAELFSRFAEIRNTQGKAARRFGLKELRLFRLQGVSATICFAFDYDRTKGI